MLKSTTATSLALDFATRYHFNQKRLNGEPYITHPIAVMAQVQSLNLGREYEMAAVLHDIYEECPDLEPAQIIVNFGQKVHFMVYTLTKESRCLFPRDASGGIMRLTHYLSRLESGFQVDPCIMFVKICDQLDNLTSLSIFTALKQQRILKEILTAYSPLYLRYQESLPISLQPKFREIFSRLQNQCWPIYA